MTTTPPNEFDNYVKIGSNLISSAEKMCKESSLKVTTDNLTLCVDIILKLQQAAILLSTITANRQTNSTREEAVNMLKQHVRFKSNDVQ